MERSLILCMEVKFSQLGKFLGRSCSLFKSSIFFSCHFILLLVTSLCCVHCHVYLCDISIHHNPQSTSVSQSYLRILNCELTSFEGNFSYQPLVFVFFFDTRNLMSTTNFVSNFHQLLSITTCMIHAGRQQQPKIKVCGKRVETILWL